MSSTSVLRPDKYTHPVSFFDAPVLANEFVHLEPLAQSHADDLMAAVAVDDLWKVWYTHVPSPDGMADAIERRLAMAANHELVPYAVVDPATNSAVGMTTYMHIEPDHRRLEIGSTWLGRSAQGTAINPAAKLLLLARAFEDLECIAVEFRTHWHNRQSRAAIEKLGAKMDGVLRNHQIFENGTLRDTAVYSIIESEWPTVRFALTERLRALS